MPDSAKLSQQSNARTVTIMRRLGAILYDAMLVFSVLFFATIPVVSLTGGAAAEPDDLFYTAYLTLIAFFYFGWQWRRGHTLGMKAWQIGIQDLHGKRISWQQALVRFCVAIVSWAVLGIGFLWSLRDQQNRTWHDRVSNTQLILLKRKPKSKADESTQGNST